MGKGGEGEKKGSSLMVSIYAFSPLVSLFPNDRKRLLVPPRRFSALRARRSAR